MAPDNYDLTFNYDLELNEKERFIAKLAIERDITYQRAEEIYNKEFEC